MQAFQQLIQELGGILTFIIILVAGCLWLLIMCYLIAYQITYGISQAKENFLNTLLKQKNGKEKEAR